MSFLSLILLNYEGCIVFSLVYAVSMCILFRVSLFAPHHGLLLLTVLGLVMCTLVAKTEKVLAGMVCKMVIWFAVMIFS